MISVDFKDSHFEFLVNLVIVGRQFENGAMGSPSQFSGVASTFHVGISPSDKIT